MLAVGYALISSFSFLIQSINLCTPSSMLSASSDSSSSEVIRAENCSLASAWEKASESCSSAALIFSSVSRPVPIPIKMRIFSVFSRTG